MEWETAIDFHTKSLTSSQAIELAKVEALRAIAEQLEQLEEHLERSEQPTNRT